MNKYKALNLELPCIIIDERGNEQEIIEIHAFRNVDEFICQLFYKNEDGTVSSILSPSTCELKTQKCK